MTSPVLSRPNPLQRIRIVLSRTSHPGNIGAAARAMKTMGLSRLYLVAPKSFPDPQAEAMASGATDVLENAVVCASLEEALTDTVFATALTARRRGLAAEPLWARQAAAELVAESQRENQSAEVALVLGNESAGLTNGELALCQRWASISANPEFSSLNVAAALQILCYELRLAAQDAGPPPPINDAGELARFEEVEGLLGHLERAAIGSGFLDPAAPKRLMPRMRRLFGRARLEKEEVCILRGMLSSWENKKPS